jgi:hypothetical protein
MKKTIPGYTLFICVATLLLFSRSVSSTSADSASIFLKFSHKLHLDTGAECIACHDTVATNTQLTEKLTPGHDQCKTCHEEQLGSTCTFCHGSDTPEKPEVTVVRDLTFDHKAHVERKVECITCHKDIPTSEMPGTHPTPSMAGCNTCHNKVTAQTQCETCHKNLATLFPNSHTKGNFRRDHGNLIRLNQFENQCKSCHDDNYCAQCHDGTNLTTISPNQKTGMISPRTLGNDKPQALAGQAVHDLNFKYTHGIEAQGKTSNCMTCHRSQQFCNDCHNNGSASMGGVMPVSHQTGGFVIVGGYGSGGGRHADMARRDIEQCASCHDVSGSEPACVQCHMDGDGVKHTDPKTHRSGFMSNVHGDWHSSPGATCYVCHTDPNAHPGGIAGQGFCGYCHSSKSR